MKIIDFFKAQKVNKVPLKLLEYFCHVCHIIEDPLTSADIEFLSRYRKIYRSKIVLRSSIRTLTESERETLVRTCKYRFSWERWVCTRVWNHMLENPGRPLPLNKILDELHVFKNIEPSNMVKSRVREIKESIRNRINYVGRDCVSPGCYFE